MSESKETIYNHDSGCRCNVCYPFECITCDDPYMKINPELEKMIREIHAKICGETE